MKGRAGGKAIIFGEHFVLHGSPALAVPVVGRSVEVSLSASPDACPRYSGPEEGRAVTQAMLARLGVTDMDVTLSGDLPLAAGLGSSAALAVALVRATGVTDPSAVRAAAHALEQIAHGRASGIDDAVISFETTLRFDPREEGERRFVRLPFAAPPFWLAWVPRVCSTKESVARVGELAASSPARFAALVARSEALVRMGEAALGAGDLPTLGALMDEAHQLLVEIGVVIDAHETLCHVARRAGALGAKTTGAGGGGAVMLLGPRTLNLDTVLADAGFEGCFFAGESI